jgi:hypothetical protein
MLRPSFGLEFFVAVPFHMNFNENGKMEECGFSIHVMSISNQSIDSASWVGLDY